MVQIQRNGFRRSVFWNVNQGVQSELSSKSYYTYSTVQIVLVTLFVLLQILIKYLFYESCIDSVQKQRYRFTNITSKKLIVILKHMSVKKAALYIMSETTFQSKKHNEGPWALLQS